MWGGREGVGTDSFLARPRRKTFLVGFVVKGMGMVTYSGSVLSHTRLQHVRNLPEFAPILSLDRSNRLRCLFWHGWLPGLNDIGGNDHWAIYFG